MFVNLEEALKSTLRAIVVDVFREFRSVPGPANHLSHDREAEPARLLLRMHDAAKAFSMSERTLWSLAKAGKIPSVRINRLVRFDPSALQDWIRETSTAKTRSRQRKVGEGETKSRPKTSAGTTRKLESEARSSGAPRGVAAFFADRLGVPLAQLPSLTNGQVMEIAGVDRVTLHGWAYLNRDLPAAALERLEAFFRSAAQSSTE